MLTILCASSEMSVAVEEGSCYIRKESKQQKSKPFESHLGSLQKYTCNISSKNFTHSSTLSIHKLIHTGVKKHKCVNVKKRLSRKLIYQHIC